MKPNKATQGGSARGDERQHELLEAYLARAHPSHRRALHDIIAAKVPNAVLALRRSVSAFRYRQRTLVSIGDAKRHVSLYVMQGHALDVHAEALADYGTSRTVVRFKPESPIPAKLVARIAHTRREEIDLTSSSSPRGHARNARPSPAGPLTSQRRS